MKDKTLSKLEELNAQLDKLEERLQGYSTEILNTRPQEGVWSALDIMHHLRLAEGFSHQYLEKKLGGDVDKIDKAGISSNLRSLALTVFMRSPGKRKAPKMVDTPEFPENSELSEVMATWRKQREHLHDFLRKQPEKVFEKEAYRHPLAGRMSLLGMLRFFESHFDRHVRQINRTLDQVSP